MMKHKCLYCDKSPQGGLGIYQRMCKNCEIRYKKR